MPRTREQSLETILRGGVVAIIRAPSSDGLLELAGAFVAGGIVAVEVTLTTPGALRAVTQMAEQLGDRAVIGAGTILDAAACREAIAAGAEYVVSPHFDPQIVQTARRYGKLSVPGAFTPTEILAAWTAGADVVKIFPSAPVGPAYVRDVLAPLPHVRVMPSGGVDRHNVADWIKAGASCVGVGSSLAPKEAVARRDWAAVAESARGFVEAVAAARRKPEGPKGTVIV